jgi:chemotaxis protein MotB
MSSSEDTSSHELVIIRRRANAEEAGHHGGVWKIAYADFMTAMMAFFLVMWLINASDKQTLIQVASYFNPLRLTDRVTSTKGMQNLDSGARGKEDATGNSKEKEGKATGEKKADAGKPKYTEEALFKDPYGILTRLALQAKRKEADDQARPGAAPRIDGHDDLAKGEAYRDPFEPAYRKEIAGKAADGRDPLQQRESQLPAAAATAADEAQLKEPQAQAQLKEPPPQAQFKELPSQAQLREPLPQGQLKEPLLQSQLKEPVPAGGAADAASGRESLGQHIAQKAAQEEAERAERAERAKIEAEIKQAVDQSGLGIVPNIDVTVTEEGVLISLTDRFDFGMFRLSSAEPRPELVVVMEKIAKIIGPRSQSLIVRGHTDGRPFKSGNYDNWRLSTARAHMAYYMLARGGIAERRFERIEGHADRSLRVPNDPEAAQNRRIEILMRKARS